MNNLNEEEIRLILFLLRTRLRYEARRDRRVIVNGQDIQNLKVRQLAALVEKLEDYQLSL